MLARAGGRARASCRPSATPGDGDRAAAGAAAAARRGRRRQPPSAIRALYDFYNQTIKSTIGLRGIGLQLKVEKAAGIADFRALRLPYLQAVLKAKGREMALSLREPPRPAIGRQARARRFRAAGRKRRRAGAFDYFNLASEAVNF